MSDKIKNPNSVSGPEITLIGAAIIDVLAKPVDPRAFTKNSQNVSSLKLSYGGDALNEAVVLSRLHKKVNLISQVGMDEGGRYVLDYLERNQVDTGLVSREENLETGINLVLISEDSERHFVTNPKGGLRSLTLADVLPKVSRAADIVCFASMFVAPAFHPAAMEELFRALKQKPGRILAADMTSPKNGETLSDLKGALKYLDLLFANETEASLLTGEQDPHRSAALLAENGVSCAVVKTGSRGCIIRTPDEELLVPAYQVSDCVDTTGAGDCFAAGFLWAMSEKMPLYDCGCFACAVASCSVEAVGATTGISSIEEPRRRYEFLKSNTSFHTQR